MSPNVYTGNRNPVNIPIPWERLLWVAPFVLLGLLAAYVLSQGLYTVKPHEKAVVLRFGRYIGTVDPGLQFCIPLVDQVLKVSVEERSLRLPFGVSHSRPTSSPEDLTLMLTADLNAASVEWTVQWRVGQPDLYLFRFAHEEDERYVERVITTVAQTVMNRLVGDYSIDEVLTEKRGEISELARQSTQEILDRYHCGVLIRDLQMQRVSPPERVRPSFDEVNASIQNRDKSESEANKERNKLLPAALAERDKMIRAAQGYADRRRAEAAGEISGLLARYDAYQRSPQYTKQRLYLESMQKIFTGVDSKVLVDAPMSRQMLPLLPVEAGAKP